MKLLLPILFALGTALCWGLYGPTLAFARSTAKPPEWSPFKPYVFIGVAYVVWAIVGGMMGMRARGDSFNFFGIQKAAMLYGFLAGTLGALGAFSLTSAMLNGGKPLFVMPIVFGGAVSVTAIVSTMRMKESISPVLWIGMTLVVVGIILVAIYTPESPKHKKDPAAEESHTAAVSTETPDTPVAESPS